MDLHNFRRDYLLGGLRRADLNLDPMKQFDQWFQEILSVKTVDPNAMVLATAGSSIEVCQRIVLLKAYNEQGFDFYTNKHSAKAHAIDQSPKVSLHFPWHFVERQVIINGVAEPLPDKDNDEYFASRPRESQLAAWASQQSQKISSRDELIDRFGLLQQQYPEDVPRPPHWGGYRVVASRIEFWQGGANRLHDRFAYTRDADNAWNSQRLSP